MFRLKKTIPPVVYVCRTWLEDNRQVRLWVRNAPLHWCIKMAQGLKHVGVITAASIMKKKDLIWRSQHLNHYVEIMIDMPPTTKDDELLRIAIQSQFRIIHNCRVEWCNTNKILNFKTNNLYNYG